MKSIFDIENEIDIQEEFERLVEVFFEYECVEVSSGMNVTIMEYLNVKVFRKWRYRHTMINIYEYLSFIGVTRDVINSREKITEEVFLRFLEFITNMLYNCKDNIPIVVGKSKFAIAVRNIENILEEKGYNVEEVEDKVVLVKISADIDAVLKVTPDNISKVLLEYNELRVEKDIQIKKQLLKQIDLYLEEFVKVRDYDKELDQTIGMIVNKMGINHPINEEPYLSLSEDELLEWYDKCFELMIHAIRFKRVKEIKEERKKLINNK